jgi:hypothetical protein
MHEISPGGFALALVILTVVWIFLPPEMRVPLAIVLILGALAATRAPVHYIQQFFSYLK